MSTDAVTLFLGLLALLAQVLVVAAVVVGVGARWSPALARAWDGIVASIGPQALALATVVALVCTAGSLYLSEVADFPPCRLCWYQRIAMYPLVVLLGLAAWRRDAGIRPYGMVLAGLGGAISVYHMAIERFPDLESGSCDPANPCSVIWVERFGYLTIPTMALSGFALIITLLATVRPASPSP